MGYGTGYPERSSQPKEGPKRDNGQLGGNRADARAREIVDFNEKDGLTKPMRITKDGIRIGCTYVTKEAADYIVKEWEASKDAE